MIIMDWLIDRSIDHLYIYRWPNITDMTHKKNVFLIQQKKNMKKGVPFISLLLYKKRKWKVKSKSKSKKKNVTLVKESYQGLWYVYIIFFSFFSMLVYIKKRLHQILSDISLFSLMKQTNKQKKIVLFQHFHFLLKLFDWNNNKQTKNKQTINW